jgi:cell division protein FtsN
MQGPQRGGMALGLIIGLVVGLAIAVAVAIYITHAPLPFVNKVQRPTATKLNPSPDAPLPDPNRALYGNSRAEPVQPAAAGDKPAEPVAEVRAGDAKGAAADRASGDPTAAEPVRYLLQVGAFKAPDDADAMLAQLALVGQQARVFPIEQGGQTLYRVRLGPYGQLEEVSRVRKLLAENSIDSQIVRLK